MRMISEDGRVKSLAVSGEDTGQSADIESYGFISGRMLTEDGSTVNIADIIGGEDTGLTADIGQYAPISGRVIAEDGRVINIAKNIGKGSSNTSGEVTALLDGSSRAVSGISEEVSTQ